MLTLGSAGVGDRRAREGAEKVDQEGRPVGAASPGDRVDGRTRLCDFALGSALLWGRPVGAIPLASMASHRAREGCAKVDQERRPVGAISQPYSRSRWRPTHSTRHRFLSASSRFWPPVESDNAPASQPIRYDPTPVDGDRAGGDPGITIASSWSAVDGEGRGRVERESIRFRPVDGRRLVDCRQVVSQIA